MDRRRETRPSGPRVRRIIAAVNEKIAAANHRPPDGPPLDLVPYEAERIVSEWRDRG